MYKNLRITNMDLVPGNGGRNGDQTAQVQSMPLVGLAPCPQRFWLNLGCLISISTSISRYSIFILYFEPYFCYEMKNINHVRDWFLHLSPEPETPPPGHHLRKILKKRKSSNDRKIARTAWILTFFNQNHRSDATYFLKFVWTGKKTNKRTIQPNEWSKNRIVQVVVIV